MRSLKPSHSPLPLFEFPTKIVLVDDDVDYVKGLQLLAPRKNLQFTTFNNPQKALDYLLEKEYCPFVSQYLGIEDNAEIFHKRIDVSLNALYQEIYDPARFDEVSLLVIDYGMPGMDGQEFCNKIEHLPIKKLLLTGEASFEKAVEMFNHGLIDKFFKKDANIDVFFETVRHLQTNYFQTITHDLLFALQNPRGLSVFSDSKFQLFFQTLCAEHEIIEYYVLDDSGSYLLADKQGALKLLITKTEEDMRVLYEIAEGDNEITPSILDALHKKKKIAFFQTEDDMTLPVTQWQLHPAHTLEGEQQIYYYAFVDAGPDFKIAKHKICSYQDYLQQ